ncbi:MAG: SGNH/GDSL hydrolase family protein [Thermoflavifilum sp.]|nr:SGNH/GDSL hydrolase family protein [Thermoflavifilum sp.]MCL6513507.1 SGNH/GDSL hydrolase family protein [Alicyclobacillus sp.]
MLYAALGDSITYGYSATEERHTFVSCIQRALSHGQRWNVYRHAKPGWTSKQLMKSLRRVPDCLWDEARLVTLLIGGNDLLRAAPWLIDGNLSYALKLAERYRVHLDEIIERVHRPGQTFLIANLYNPFPESAIVGESIRVMNDVIERAARRHDLVLVDLSATFRGREPQYIEGFRRGQLRDFRLFGNPIHPTDAGHAAIAETLLRAYRRHVARSRVSKQKARLGGVR